MGAPANLVLVDARGLRLHKDKWAAETVARDAFWGPSATIAWLEGSFASSTDDAFWGEDHCDGGVLVHVPRRVMRVFGGSDPMIDVPLRRVYLALLRETWPGWDVGWAEDGVLDLAREAGHADLASLVWQPPIEPASKLAPLPLARLVPNAVASVRWADGRLGVYATLAHPEAVLALPASDLLARLVALEAASPPVRAVHFVSARSFRGPPRGELRADGTLVVASGGGVWPGGSLHLDVGAKTISAWWGRSGNLAVLGRIARRCSPDWTFVSWGSRFEEHTAATGGRLSWDAPPERQLLDDACELLGAGITDPERRTMLARARAAFLARRAS